METNTRHANSFIGQITSNLLTYASKTFPSSFKYLLKYLVFQDDIYSLDPLLHIFRTFKTDSRWKNRKREKNEYNMTNSKIWLFWGNRVRIIFFFSFFKLLTITLYYLHNLGNKGNTFSLIKTNSFFLKLR